jgi:hypothetical protein
LAPNPLKTPARETDLSRRGSLRRAGRPAGFAGPLPLPSPAEGRLQERPSFDRLRGRGDQRAGAAQ